MCCALSGLPVALAALWLLWSWASAERAREEQTRLGPQARAGRPPELPETSDLTGPPARAAAAAAVTRTPPPAPQWQCSSWD